MPADIVLGSIGLVLGLVLALIGVIGPVIVRDPSRGRTFGFVLLAGLVMVVISLLWALWPLGFGPDVVLPAQPSS